MYTEAGHFGGFVAGDRGEDPSAERIPTVSLVKIPDLDLKKLKHLSEIIRNNH